MTKSTVSAARNKPAKPRPDFPLFAHANGRWEKKVRGKLCYFGKWADDPKGDAALRLWADQKDQLLAGKRQPDINGTAMVRLPLHELVNRYLNAQRVRLDSGRIRPRTFAEYVATGERLIAEFGRYWEVDSLGPADFEKLYATLAKTRGLVALGNEITRTRMIFAWGFENGVIESPVRFGTVFQKPSREDIAKHRANSSEDRQQTFSADELRRILKAIEHKPTLYAMTLLAINVAYGQSDCARLKIKQVDLEHGWARSQRPKTGADRGAKLWTETITAIRAAMGVRPQPLDEQDAGLLFLTAKGKPWVRESDGVTEDGEVDPKRWAFRTDLIGNEFGKVLKSLDINSHRGFYNIRHTAASIADQTGDRMAVQYLMGHKDSTITGNYTHHRPSDERMQVIADHLYDWLFGNPRS